MLNSRATNVRTHRSSTSLPINYQGNSPELADADDDRVTTSPGFSTPHDAVLAELHGHLKDTNHRGDAHGPSQEGLSGENIASVERLPDVSAPNLVRSTSAAPTYTSITTANTPAISGEAIYDPFTGHELGELHSTSSSNSGKDEELWTHLSRVLSLQSEIAKMHVGMENIGGARPEERGKGKKREEEWSNDEGEGIEIGEEGVEQETARNRKREKEFSSLADKFTGRKDAIDQIMSKLDNLSQEVTLFHSLVTPTIDFSSASRANTANVNVDPNSTKPTPQTTTSANLHPARPNMNPNPNLAPSAGPVAASRSSPMTNSNTNQLVMGVLGEHGRRRDMVESPVDVGDAPSSLEQADLPLAG